MFLITAGGWFDSTLMYLRVLFGFEYGMYCPVFRSSVISKKFTTFLFASTVILRLFWRKILQMSFFIHSLYISGWIFEKVIDSYKAGVPSTPSQTFQSQALIKMATV